jgi:type I restriction enzyme, S subunit
MAVEALLGALPSGWTYATLGEACRRGGGDIQTGPFGSQLHAADYVQNGVPSIMPANIGDNRVIEDGIARISEADAQRLRRYRVRIGDIIYSRRGDVERRALIRSTEDGWLCGTGCLRVRLGDRGADPKYAAYYLGHPSVREWTVRHAHGATMANLNTSILSNCPFVLPPPEDQRAIASILGVLDDKIELNRRMNQTLEALARATFKSWFVDFDPVRAKAEGRKPFGMDDATAALFPDRFGPDGLPELWRVIPVYDIANYINGAAYKDIHFSSRNTGLPVVKIAELKNGVTNQTRFTEQNLGSKYRIDTGDILFSWSGNPDTSIDVFVWEKGPAWLNQHIFAVRPNSNAWKIFIFIQLKVLIPVFAEIARNKQTTGLGHVTARDMKGFLVCLPTEDVASTFDAVVEPMFDGLLSNLKEIQILTSLRELLLPKLISGEIRVKDAEDSVEGVI